MEDSNKITRMFDLYNRFQKGEIICKPYEANRYDVSERTIQRDIEDIRNYLEQSTEDSVVYDRIEKGYRLERIYQSKFSNSEILALCKILLDSRAFTKGQMMEMLDKLLDCCVPKSSQKLIEDLIRNEAFHYIEPHHKSVFTDKMWDIGQAIRHNQYIEMEYVRSKDKSKVKRKVQPVAILFSEYYFYLTAFIEDEMVRKDFDVINDSFPTIYRIDRIKKLKVLDEQFHIPYANRFEEGEFRKRIQFMYGGSLQKVRFVYSGVDIDTVLDRLPTAKILTEENGKYVVEAEVFGKGIDMWLRSQGENVIVLK